MTTPLVCANGHRWTSAEPDGPCPVCAGAGAPADDPERTVPLARGPRSVPPAEAGSEHLSLDQCRRLLGDEPDPDRAAVEAHLEACPRCQQQLQALLDESVALDARSWTLLPSGPFRDGRLGERDEAVLDRLRTAPPPTAPPPDPEPWPVVPGYRIEAELGRGGMGVVYLARQVALNRRVALKMILESACAGPEHRARFAIEAEMVASLRHPDIVQIHEVGAFQGRPFFALEYIDGESLHDRLQRGPLAPRDGVGLVERLARAVAHAHRHGIVHRDLKPGNILFTRLGDPKIVDFGVAKRFEGDENLTATGALVGTPRYMSPEQAGGQGVPVGPASDIWSLGAILYELLTGRPPFVASNPLEVMVKVVHEEPAVPAPCRGGKLPRDLVTIVLRCLEKEPAKRYASAESLAEDLRRFLDGEPIAARRVGELERLWRWARRRPALVAMLLVAFLSLVGATAVSTVFAFRAEQSAREADANARRARDETSLRRRHLYVAQMNLAHVAWRDLQPGQALDLLQRQRPAPGEEDLRGFEWHYLWQLCHNHRASFEHAGAVTDIAVDRRGERVMAAVVDGSVVVRRLATGAVESEVRLHRQAVHAVAFSPDDRHAVSAGSERDIRVWEIATGKVLRELQGHRDPVLGLAFSPDGRWLASCGGNPDVVSSQGLGEVKLWDWKGGGAPRNLVGHSLAVRAVAFSPDGRFLASAGNDHTVRVWDVETGQAHRTIPLRRAVTFGVVFSPDGELLGLAGADGAPLLLAWKTGLPRKLAADPDWLYTTAFSPDGGTLLAAGGGRALRLYDVKTGALVRTIRGHRGSIRRAHFIANGRRVVTAASDRNVRVWDVDDEGEVVRLPQMDWAVRGLAFGPGGTLLAGGDYTGRIKLFDVSSRQVIHELPRHPTSILGLRWDRSSNRIASGSTDGLVQVCDAGTGRPLFRSTAWQGFLSADLAPGGRQLAVALEHRLLLIDLETSEEKWSRREGLGPRCSVAFSPDGARLAVGGAGTIRLLETATGREVSLWRGMEHPVAVVAFSPDGRWLASGGGATETTEAPAELLLWDVASGTVQRRLQGHIGLVTDACWSPDGRRIASSCTRDKCVKLWDVETGLETLTLRTQNGWVYRVAFSPDGSTLASGNDTRPGGVALWLPNGRQ